MINIEKQRELLITIGKKIQKNIVVYAIGGTAMMLNGLKEETLDIDLVFANEKERQIFRKIAFSLGYKEMDARIIYSTRESSPILIKLEDSLLDLFLLNILGVKFSDSMKERATQTHEFGHNLLIKPADIHDIIIMKSATDRIKDEEDIISIILNNKIKWEILIHEAKNQVKLGNEVAIMNLGKLLEKLRDIHKINIPKETINNLWKLFNKQAKEKNKRTK